MFLQSMPYKAPVVSLIGSQSMRDGVCSTSDIQFLTDPCYEQRIGQMIAIVQILVVNNLSPFQKGNAHPAIFFLCIHNFFYFYLEGSAISPAEFCELLPVSGHTKLDSSNYPQYSCLSFYLKDRISN